MKYSFLAAAFVVFALAACEGKKSLDGHPMDKPPPSAYAPRDSEPNLDKNKTTADESDTTESSY